LTLFQAENSEADSDEAAIATSSETSTLDGTISHLQMAAPASMEIETVIAVEGSAKPQQIVRGRPALNPHNDSSQLIFTAFIYIFLYTKKEPTLI
jgi:hypothetical protein